MIFQLYSNGIIEFSILHEAFFMWMTKNLISIFGKRMETQLVYFKKIRRSNMQFF